MPGMGCYEKISHTLAYIIITICSHASYSTLESYFFGKNIYMPFITLQLKDLGILSIFVGSWNGSNPTYINLTNKFLRDGSNVHTNCFADAWIYFIIQTLTQTTSINSEHVNQPKHITIVVLKTCTNTMEAAPCHHTKPHATNYTRQQTTKTVYRTVRPVQSLLPATKEVKSTCN